MPELATTTCPAAARPVKRRIDRVFPTRPGAVPVRAFARVLAPLLASPHAPTQTQLAQLTGIPERTIYRVLNCVDRSVMFDVADALLVALDAHDAWHCQPLADHLPPPPTAARLLSPVTQRQEAARQRALQRRRGRTVPARHPRSNRMCRR